MRKGQHLRIDGDVSGGKKVVLNARAGTTETSSTTRELHVVDGSSRRLSDRGTARATVRVSGSSSKKVSVKYAELVSVDAPVVPDTRLVLRDPLARSHGDTAAATRFTFDSTAPDATFSCALDDAPYAPCVSPLEPSGLFAGTHRLQVRATSYFGVTDQTPAERTFSVGAARPKPSATTTGVPAGTSLTVHEGDIVVTKAGTHLDSLDVHGAIIVKAADVTISRSVVRGGPEPARGSGLIVDYGYPRLLVEDTDVVPSYPSVNTDGIKGWDFTARRVHVVGNVDSIKIHGDDVLIEDSLLENTTWYAHDPYQDGGPTHNDNVQVLMGTNITIVGNTIRGASNFAILGAANKGDAVNLRVEDNWLDGGHCTVKFQSMNAYKLTATLFNNKFGENRAVSYCSVQAEPQVVVTDHGNVFEASGKSVSIYRGR